MALPERQEWVLFKKLRANRLFKLKHYEEAVDSYMEGLAGAMMNHDNPLVIALLCNLSSCMIKQNQPARAVDLCNRAMEIDPLNERALERKGFALLLMGRSEEALKTLQTAKTHCKNPGIQSLVSQHLARVNKVRSSERILYKKMMVQPPPESHNAGWFGSIVGVLSKVVSVATSVTHVCKRRRTSET